MAVMIPDIPYDLPQYCVERRVLEELSKLSDDFFIFHRHTVNRSTSSTRRDGDTDMVIFNRNRGIVCADIIDGLLSYKDGKWYYDSGLPFDSGGPDKRAAALAEEVRQRISSSSLSGILDRCGIYKLVWFLEITDMIRMYMELPEDFSCRLQLADALNDGLWRFAYRIFSPIKGEGDYVKTDLSEEEAYQLITEVLCPMFNRNLNEFVFYH